MALPDGESRFAFGENWRSYLRLLNDERIQIAEESLLEAFEIEDFAGKTFLDVGCGSGLFSLAARRLGATVHSIDVDPVCVACASELKQRFFPKDNQWTIEEGSAVDEAYLGSLARFDVVYAWGVLHHTGNLWKAVDLTQRTVRPGGQLCVAIYNDQGRLSVLWTRIKKLSNTLPSFLRPGFATLVMLPRELASAVFHCLTLRPGRYVRSWTHYRSARGMSRWHDLLDWVGGWPFEVAKPEVVFEFLKRRGFSLIRMKTAGGGLGCNELVFRKEVTDVTRVDQQRSDESRGSGA